MTFGQASASTQILGAATFDPREAHLCTGWTIYRCAFHVTHNSASEGDEEVAPRRDLLEEIVVDESYFLQAAVL
jgi:hypothetical protein